ncbi:sugar transferase [Pseudaestuariivita sp.]|uniref:sugar transferase n=1 Tax=Pseudaestuariivita sp. TaxID=2211669 RepID=UPI0040583D53
MTPAKRVFDIVAALALSLLLLPLVLVLSALILLRDGRPIFYVSERMKDPVTPFNLIKFRTMTTDTQDRGVSGGDKAHRITRTGAMMRAKRLDEIPQLWNILRGDISFVGPRPPLRRYVDLRPDLYAEVLKSRPGVTGLATLAFHRREEELLATCATADETENVYVRRCVPTKARLDLIYARNRSLCYDVQLMVATVFRRVPLRKRRA